MSHWRGRKKNNRGLKRESPPEFGTGNTAHFCGDSGISGIENRVGTEGNPCFRACGSCRIQTHLLLLFLHRAKEIRLSKQETVLCIIMDDHHDYVLCWFTFRRCSHVCISA